LRLLVIDTAGDNCSAGVFDDERSLAERCERLNRGQAERIVPMVGEVMAEAGCAWDQLDLIVATIGPGTYTGIRAGLAAARGFAMAAGQLTVGVSTLEALAGTMPLGRRVTALIGGRGGGAFVQRFAEDGAPMDEPQPINRSAIDRAAEVGTVIEDAAAVGPGPVATAALRKLARGADPAPGSSLYPLYLREPDARPDAGRPLIRAAD
jgi:tRNA threonylcarbamoyl adenosine modification protein YeaZ